MEKPRLEVFYYPQEEVGYEQVSDFYTHPKRRKYLTQIVISYGKMQYCYTRFDYHEHKDNLDEQAVNEFIPRCLKKSAGIKLTRTSTSYYVLSYTEASTSKYKEDFVEGKLYTKPFSILRAILRVYERNHLNYVADSPF